MTLDVTVATTPRIPLGRLGVSREMEEAEV
jgi:hypothetical protein